MSQIQSAGGQPQKQPKYASLYTSKVFNGLVTNRSPLRGVLSSMYEQFYKMTYGDVMIAGSNVEISNRLTLVRRPGNPAFNSNTYANVQSFDEFPVTKATPDAFGAQLEEIFTMISTPYNLYAENDSNSALPNYGVKQLVFNDASASGQTYMQPIGNTLYFSNGVDNKKWFQSLIFWAANYELQGSTGTAGTYPFYSTYMLTGSVSASANTQQVQQLIAIACAQITNVQVADGVLTLTINNTSLPNSDGATYQFTQPQAGVVQQPTFQIWGCNGAPWLNGGMFYPTSVNGIPETSITILNGESYTISGPYVAPTADATYNEPESGLLTQIGTTPVVGITGASQPTWPTNATAVVNTNTYWGSLNTNSPNPGNVVLDGNLVWVCRGSTVQNWGIEAPDTAPTTSDINSSTTGWVADTYYSAPGIMIDPANPTNIWQVMTAGITGTTNTFPSTGTPYTTTHSDGSVEWLMVGNASTSTWTAGTNYYEGKYAGAYPWTGTVTIDGVTYNSGQFIPDWQSGSFVIATIGTTAQVFMLQRYVPGVTPVPPLSTYGTPTGQVPISVAFGGGHSGDIGWSASFFNGSSRVAGIGVVDLTYSGTFNSPILYGGGSEPPALTVNSLTSIMWNFYNTGGGNNFDQHPMVLDTISSAGVMSTSSHTTPWSGMPTDNYQIMQWGDIRIPWPGMNVTFLIAVNDACFFGIESSAGATFVSYSPGSGTGATALKQNLGNVGSGQLTPVNGYTPMAGWNGQNNGNWLTCVVNFPSAGVFGIEFCYGKAAGGTGGTHNFLTVTANGSLMVPEANSGTGTSTHQKFFDSCPTSPTFGSASFNTTPAAQNTYPSAPENSDNPAGGYSGSIIPNQTQELYWYNLGPVSSMTWAPSQAVTVPSAIVIDSNSNQERAYESGVTGLTSPAGTGSGWNTSKYGVTLDNSPPGTLAWINEGPIGSNTNAAGTVTATSQQGYLYWVALGNSLDDTVSNLSPVSKATGPIVQGNITLGAGDGFGPNFVIDPQVDQVLIFRTVDDGSTPLLIPGLGNQIYTLPLTTYLQNGYIDTTPDTDLDDEIEGANADENSPPITGAINLAYHLSRGWYSVGNIVYYTAGPTAPVGNGNGTPPLNYDTLPSRVVRLVPTAIGMLVYTVSDLYIIAGNGTSNNPILPAVPYEPGIGLANYNALDVNGALIGWFTTDKQFLIFDPSAGLNYVGFPIGDQFRLNNGTPGQSWNTADVYVAWNVNGEDAAWYVCDGKFGWYKLIDKPAPEAGFCWSPFSTIVAGGIQGNVGAIASVETTPGVHNLLIGPGSTNGNILSRNLLASTDGGTGVANGTTYLAYGVFGSFVLALPGQVAKVMFIMCKSLRVGSPMVLGVLIDEAMPYYSGSMDIIKRWETDPPNLPQSKSFYKQRFYMSEDHSQSAYCSDLQFMVSWPAEAALNEMQTFSIWGAYEIEA